MIKGTKMIMVYGYINRKVSKNIRFLHIYARLNFKKKLIQTTMTLLAKSD